MKNNDNENIPSNVFLQLQSNRKKPKKKSNRIEFSFSTFGRISSNYVRNVLTMKHINEMM